MTRFFLDVKAQIGTYYDSIVALLPKLGIAVVVCAIVFVTVRFIRRRVMRYLRRRADDTLLLDFFDSLIRVLNGVVITLLFMYIVGLGWIASSILGAAGLSAFVIGFALRDIGENFLAGVIMAFDRPFKLGDVVQTGSVEGTITEMSLRDTHIKTFDGKDVYVPNGQIIKQPLSNYTTDGLLRGNYSVTVAYDSDVSQVRSILMDVLLTIPGILVEGRGPITYVQSLSENGVTVMAQYWFNTFDKEHSSLEIKSQAQIQSIIALQTAGIKMPATVIEVKDPSSLLP